MVDQQNHSAIRLYLSLGMSYRALTAAYVSYGATSNQNTSTSKSPVDGAGSP